MAHLNFVIWFLFAVFNFLYIGSFMEGHLPDGSLGKALLLLDLTNLFKKDTE